MEENRWNRDSWPHPQRGSQEPSRQDCSLDKLQKTEIVQVALSDNEAIKPEINEL